MPPKDTSHDSTLADAAHAVFGQPSEVKPFLVQLRQEEKQPNGSFRPAAVLQLTPSFRTSGLLFSLAPEDLKSLLFLLTFLSPNGECKAALHQLAAAMRVSAFKVGRRMNRLTAFVWNNAPLVLEQKMESSLVTFSLHPHLIAYENWIPPEPAPFPSVSALRSTARSAVIAHSRARYGKPRAEVEREMAQHMGWDKKEQEQVETAGQMEAEFQSLTPHARAVLQRLEGTGLTTEQGLELLRAYDLLRIERQLQWLPYRHAKNPAGLLLAAIADNYEAPPSMRSDARYQASTAGASPNEKEEWLGEDQFTEIPVPSVDPANPNLVPLDVLPLTNVLPLTIEDRP